MTKVPFHSKLFRNSQGEETATSSLDTYVWEENGNYEGNLRGYCIEQFIRENAEDSMECFIKSRNQFRLKDGRRVPIIQEGMIFFSIDGRLCLLEVTDCVEEIKHTLRSKEDISSLAEAINAFIREQNPIRGNFLQMIPADGNNLTAVFRENPEIAKEDLILDPVTLEDLFDNTLVTLRDLKESTAPPGCCPLNRTAGSAMFSRNPSASSSKKISRRKHPLALPPDSKVSWFPPKKSD